MTTLRRQYSEYLTLHGYSERTHESYIGAVEALAKHYWRSPDQIGDGEIREHLLGLHRAGRSYSTVNVAVSGLRLFYCQVLGRNPQGLEECLPRPGKETRRARVYSTEEIGRILEACGNPFARTFLMTVYGAGLRLNETCHLRPGDIEEDRAILRVGMGKGRKDRYTILCPWLAEELRRYRDWARPEPWLFPARRDPRKPMLGGTAQKLFYAALARAGLPNRGGIHCLRHSFATHLLESGGDLVTLGKLLGHEHLSTTAGYVNVTRERIAGVADPLGKSAGG